MAFPNVRLYGSEEKSQMESGYRFRTQAILTTAVAPAWSNR